VILGTRLGVLAMRPHGGGVIVNTASMGGLLPMPTAPVYAATKAGVIHFTRSLAYLKDEANIRVNAICPSYVDTPLLWRGSEEQRRLAAERAAAIGGPLQPERAAQGGLGQVRDDRRAGGGLCPPPSPGLAYPRQHRRWGTGAGHARAAGPPRRPPRCPTSRPRGHRGRCGGDARARRL